MNQFPLPTDNIRDLHPRVFQSICDDLDLGLRWRDLVECAEGTRFELSIGEIESCASVIHRNLHAKPATELLMKWGSMGMPVKQLIAFLSKLRMERILVHIRAPDDLAITLQPELEVTVDEGGKINLTCEATGFPYPIYVWFHGDRKLSIQQDGRLTIDQARMSHSGKYICRIHQKRTSEMPYVFTEWCNVVVRSCPGAFQEKDGNKFKLYSDDQPVSNITIPEHVVEVKHQKIENCIHLQISEPPTILLEPTSRSDAIGGHTLFVVKADHRFDQLFYQWHHNSSPIEGAVSNELRVQIRGKENAGNYQCRVYTRNHVGVLSKVATLTVEQIPNVFTAADKVALIIGISTYRSYGQPLPAVEHDLYTTVKMFSKMKFKVISLLDLTLIEMVNAVDEFCAMLTSEVYAVFYCAGHGFVSSNLHYLVPWDARHGSDLKELLCIEAVEAKIQLKKPKMLMMFLDICRTGVEHINQKNLPPLKQSSNANKITIYAASAGEQAFEQSERTCRVPRGIFNQYLLEVLEKTNLNAFQVFESLLSKFKDCPYNREKFPQHPEMTINLEESGRSLWDPIDPDKLKIVKQARKHCCWEIMQYLPPNFSVKINETDSIHLSFHKVASNVMDMIAHPQLITISRVQLELPKESMDPVLQPITQLELVQSEKKAIKFRFPNLQRLQSKLVLHLVIRLYASSSSSEVTETRVCTVDLGQPSISSCSLGEIKYPSPNDRKQPMEHAENSMLLSDSQA